MFCLKINVFLLDIKKIVEKIINYCLINYLSVLITSFILYTRFRSKINDRNKKIAEYASHQEYDEEIKVEQTEQTVQNSYNNKRKMDNMREVVKPSIAYSELTTVVEMSVFDGNLNVDEQSIAKQDSNGYEEQQLLLQQNQSFSCGCVDSGISDESSERPDIVVGCAELLLSNSLTDAINGSAFNKKHVFITDNNQMNCITSSDDNVCVYGFDENVSNSDIILRY